MLQDIVDNSFEVAKEQKAVPGGYITLERDIATIPCLASTFLSTLDTAIPCLYVPSFLCYLCLLADLEEGQFCAPQSRVEKYIPNLITKPFQVTKEYA